MTDEVYVDAANTLRFDDASGTRFTVSDEKYAYVKQTHTDTLKEANTNVAPHSTPLVCAVQHSNFQPDNVALSELSGGPTSAHYIQTSAASVDQFTTANGSVGQSTTEDGGTSQFKKENLCELQTKQKYVKNSNIVFGENYLSVRDAVVRSGFVSTKNDNETVDFEERRSPSNSSLGQSEDSGDDSDDESYVRTFEDPLLTQTELLFKPYKKNVSATNRVPNSSTSINTHEIIDKFERKHLIRQIVLNIGDSEDAIEIFQSDILKEGEDDIHNISDERIIVIVETVELLFIARNKIAFMHQMMECVKLLVRLCLDIATRKTLEYDTQLSAPEAEKRRNKFSDSLAAFEAKHEARFEANKRQLTCRIALHELDNLVNKNSLGLRRTGTANPMYEMFAINGDMISDYGLNLLQVYGDRLIGILQGILSGMKTQE
jgi:hypothetical protein